MLLVVVSFIAGVLTVAAPCILPLLPVVVARSVFRPDGTKDEQPYRLFVVIGSLGISVILFTLLLKASTTLLGVPQQVWQTVSAGIIGLFGIYLVWPHGWEWLSTKLKLSSRSNSLMQASHKHSGVVGDAILGFSLGPIFNSCSPTYLFIVALILGGSFSEGFAYLISYTLGLTLTLLAIALLGQRVVKKLNWLANPNGLFKKITGVILVIVAIGIFFGLDKKLQTLVIDNGWYAPLSELELKLKN